MFFLMCDVHLDDQFDFVEFLCGDSLVVVLVVAFIIDVVVLLIVIMIYPSICSMDSCLEESLYCLPLLC